MLAKDMQKVALITGAGHGIGRAAARLMAGKGYAVGVNDLRQGFVDEAVNEITGLGGTAIPLVYDIGTRRECRQRPMSCLPPSAGLTCW